VFEPEEITISSGETVTWEFESAGHNVSAWPEMNEEIAIPEGAEGSARWNRAATSSPSSPG